MRLSTTFLALGCVLPALACRGSGSSQAVMAARSSARGTQIEFDRVMERVGETLGPTQSFSFEATIEMDRPIWGVADPNFRGTITVRVRRPDRFRVDFRGENVYRTIEYDGRSLAMIDHVALRYSRFPVGVGIRSTLARCEELGLRIPFAVLLSPEPRQALVSSARKGRYVRVERDATGATHELTFELDGRNWEAWVREENGRFLPQRIRVVGEEGAIRSDGELGAWNLDARLPLDDFSFHSPIGSVVVAFEEL